MKKFILLSFLFFAATLLHAQKTYFIYIQTEAPAPFYVKMGDKIWSSTSQGYLILPSLRDSSYQFSVGSPGQKERKYSVMVDHKDRGFLLKDFSGSWGLFDLQSMEVIHAQPEEKQPGPIAYRTDEFSKKLALAVDDPSLLFVFAKVEQVATQALVVNSSDPGSVANDTTGEVKTQETNDLSKSAVSEDDNKKNSVDQKALDQLVNEETAKANDQKVDSGMTVQKALDTVVQSSNVAQAEEKPYQRSVVTRRSESSTTEGFGLVFLDQQDGVTDTIRILIPNPPIVYKTEADIRNESEVASGTREIQKDEHKLDPVTDSAAVLLPPATCPDLATESDYKKLRKDMVAKDNEEDMVDRARKVFRTKCFTTEQVKTLGALFLTPGGRYSFFDAAYGHVSDPSRFGTLRSELSNDEYYLKRFKALIGE